MPQEFFVGLLLIFLGVNHATRKTKTFREFLLYLRKRNTAAVLMISVIPLVIYAFIVNPIFVYLGLLPESVDNQIFMVLFVATSLFMGSIVIKNEEVPLWYDKYLFKGVAAKTFGWALVAGNIFLALIIVFAYLDSIGI